MTDEKLDILETVYMNVYCKERLIDKSLHTLLPSEQQEQKKDTGLIFILLFLIVHISFAFPASSFPELLSLYMTDPLHKVVNCMCSFVYLLVE